MGNLPLHIPKGRKKMTVSSKKYSRNYLAKSRKPRNLITFSNENNSFSEMTQNTQKNNDFFFQKMSASDEHLPLKRLCSSSHFFGKRKKCLKTASQLLLVVKSYVSNIHDFILMRKIM